MGRLVPAARTKPSTILVSDCCGGWVNNEINNAVRTIKTICRLRQHVKVWLSYTPTVGSASVENVGNREMLTRREFPKPTLAKLPGKLSKTLASIFCNSSFACKAGHNGNQLERLNWLDPRAAQGNRRQTASARDELLNSGFAEFSRGIASCFVASQCQSCVALPHENSSGPVLHCSFCGDCLLAELKFMRRRPENPELSTAKFQNCFDIGHGECCTARARECGRFAGAL